MAEVFGRLQHTTSTPTQTSAQRDELRVMARAAMKLLELRSATLKREKGLRGARDKLPGRYAKADARSPRSKRVQVVGPPQPAATTCRDASPSRRLMAARCAVYSSKSASIVRVRRPLHVRSSTMSHGNRHARRSPEGALLLLFLERACSAPHGFHARNSYSPSLP